MDATRRVLLLLLGGGTRPWKGAPQSDPRRLARDHAGLRRRCLLLALLPRTTDYRPAHERGAFRVDHAVLFHRLDVLRTQVSDLVPHRCRGDHSLNHVRDRISMAANSPVQLVASAAVYYPDLLPTPPPRPEKMGTLRGFFIRHLSVC